MTEQAVTAPPGAPPVDEARTRELEVLAATSDYCARFVGCPLNEMSPTLHRMFVAWRELEALRTAGGER